MALEPRLSIKLASNNATMFSNARSNDVLIYPQNTTQRILIGNSGNRSNSILLISSNNIQYNSRVFFSNFTNMNVLGVSGLIFSSINPCPPNLTSVTATGFSNTSTGLRFNIDSNSYQTTFTAGTSITELMRLTGTGFLGIGDSNPSQKLFVTGDINCTSNLYLGSNIGPGQSNDIDITGSNGNLICSGTISAKNIGLFRNRVINGNMLINQRGVYALGIGNGSIGTTYLMDRMAANYNQPTGQLLLSNVKLADGESPYLKGHRYSFRMTALSNCSPNSNISMMHVIEGKYTPDLAWGTNSGSPVTVSFWMKTNVATNSQIAFSLHNSPSNYTYNSNINVTSSSNWQYVARTIPAPPSGSTWSTSNIAGVLMRIGGFGNAFLGGEFDTGWQAGNIIGLQTSTNLWQTASNYLEVTGLQFERGTLATPFEFRPFNLELQLCQRYYSTSLATNKGYGAPGSKTGSNGAHTYWASSSVYAGIQGPNFPEPMRTAPSFNFWNTYTGSNSCLSVISTTSNETPSTIVTQRNENCVTKINLTPNPTHRIYQYGYYADAEIY